MEGNCRLHSEGFALGNNCENIEEPLGVFNVRNRRSAVLLSLRVMLNAGPRTKIILVTSFVKAAMVTNEAIGPSDLLYEYFYRVLL